MCSHCKVRRVRSDRQFYCKNCHAASARAYYLEKKRELERAKQDVREMTVDNTHTRMEFEKRCGTLRRVLVIDEKHQVIECSADVLRFLPHERVEVRVTTTKQVRIVSLDQIRPDRHYVPLAEECDGVGEDAFSWRRPARPNGKRGKVSYIPDSAHTAGWRRKQRAWEKSRRKRRR